MINIYKTKHETSNDSYKSTADNFINFSNAKNRLENIYTLHAASLSLSFMCAAVCK